MKNVNSDLYDFLKDHETGLYKTNEYYYPVMGYVHIPFYDLQDFVDIVGKYPFEEGGIDVKMFDDTICIDLNIIIEGEGQELSDYKNCFNESDWEDYFGKED